MVLPKDLRSIMALARKYNASDIHIVAKLPPLLRIAGEIVLADTPPLSPEDTKRLCFSIMNDEQKRIYEKDWQLCSSVFDDEFGRFRVSVYNQNNNPEMSIRPVAAHVRTRQELGLPPQIEDFTRYSSGLVLVTGPTGSGKTTTMNYLIDLINSERRCKIITIEDPIEYVHERKRAIVVQQEVHTDVKSFAKALVHVLRQDPDVICVGEMRDMDTTETALTAAETGHLVLATCHTPSAAQTIERIVSIFPENQQAQIITQLANSLRAIVAQRLVPSMDKKHVVLASELLIADNATKKHIREGEFHQLINVIQTGRKHGMRLMDDSLIDLYQHGEISYDTCLNNANNPLSVKEKIHK